MQVLYETTKRTNYVVLSSPASTGKTSLLQLLTEKLTASTDKTSLFELLTEKLTKEEKQPVHIVDFPIRSKSVEELFRVLEQKGINLKEKDQLKKLRNTWLLIDDAQNAYVDECSSFWERLLKDGNCADAKGLFVVQPTTSQ